MSQAQEPMASDRHAPAGARQAPRCVSIAHVVGLCRGCGRSTSTIHIAARRAYCPACCPICNPRTPLSGGPHAA